jgi:soluble lytic murein transglycosylase-like protein
VVKWIRRFFASAPVALLLLVGLTCSGTSSTPADLALYSPDDAAPAGTPQAVPSARTEEPSGRPLTDLELAAAELGHRKYADALERLRASTPPPAGSDGWLVAGALQGRALRLLGRHEEAVKALEPLWSQDDVRFPKDALGLELARARLGWARSGALDVTEADTQRKLAIDALGRVVSLRPLRNLPEVRVERARALVELRGTSEKEEVEAARKAIASLDDVLRDYPAYPRVGTLKLEHARALRRSGKTTDSTKELRLIALTRAGEPEADAAWTALTGHDEQHKPADAAPFSVRENLERAVAARRLHHVDLSRTLLDTIAADTNAAKATRDEAIRSRATTAYLQQDYAQCTADLLPLYQRTKSVDVRDSLGRCFERAGKYEEALELWIGPAGNKPAPKVIASLWEAIELAFRGGLYQRTSDLLAEYEKVSKLHAPRRAWLRAWLPYRLGRWEEAITAFAQAERQSVDQTRARYFRGALLLQHGDEKGRNEGAEVLRAVVNAGPYGYYGLQARQRLLDAGLEAPPSPALEPLPEEASPPSRDALQDRFDELDAAFGESWPSIRRARRLFSAGYLEEARRELRIAVDGFLSKDSASRGPHSESLLQGLGWKAAWSAPPLELSAAARAMLRDKNTAEALRRGLRTLARGLEEPFDVARLTTASEAPFFSRWHLRAYRNDIEREARLREIDPIHLWSLMYAESNFHRHVVSPVGARGALQIMPSTARLLAERLGELEAVPFDDDSLFDIETNSHLAAYYVAELFLKFHDQAPMAYASYNGGPHNVARWLAAKSKGAIPLTLDAFVEEIPFSETYHYTQRVMEVSARYAALYRGEVPRWSNAVDGVIENNINF